MPAFYGASKVLAAFCPLVSLLLVSLLFLLFFFILPISFVRCTTMRLQTSPFLVPVRCGKPSRASALYALRPSVPLFWATLTSSPSLSLASNCSSSSIAADRRQLLSCRAHNAAAAEAKATVAARNKAASALLRRALATTATTIDTGNNVVYPKHLSVLSSVLRS